MASLSAATPTTIPALRSVAALASPYDVLRIIAPEKAVLFDSTLNQISALADYVQSLCGYLAANEALEPAHAVICKLLRTGADFERAAVSSSIHVDAAAMALLCLTRMSMVYYRRNHLRPPLAAALVSSTNLAIASGFKQVRVRILPVSTSTCALDASLPDMVCGPAPRLANALRPTPSS